MPNTNGEGGQEVPESILVQEAQELLERTREQLKVAEQVDQSTMEVGERFEAMMQERVALADEQDANEATRFKVEVKIKALEVLSEEDLDIGVRDELVGQLNEVMSQVNARYDAINARRQEIDDDPFFYKMVREARSNKERARVKEEREEEGVVREEIAVELRGYMGQIRESLEHSIEKIEALYHQVVDAHAAITSAERHAKEAQGVLNTDLENLRPLIGPVKDILKQVRPKNFIAINELAGRVPTDARELNAWFDKWKEDVKPAAVFGDKALKELHDMYARVAAVLIDSNLNFLKEAQQAVAQAQEQYKGLVGQLRELQIEPLDAIEAIDDMNHMIIRSKENLNVPAMISSEDPSGMIEVLNSLRELQDRVTKHIEQSGGISWTDITKKEQEEGKKLEMIHRLCEVAK